jgi:glucose-6-phosphate isomerase
MVKFDLSLLAKVKRVHGVTPSEFKKFEQTVGKYVTAMQSRGQDFLKVLDDRETLKKIGDFAAKARDRYSDIVVLGIGGSALGAICLQNALGKLFEKPAFGTVRLTVLDNIDPLLLAEFEKSVDLKRTLFLVITKSGGTPETLAQFLYFKSLVSAKKLDWLKHFVFITDPRKGLLRDLARKNPGLPVFDVPEKVGGRFSVLTAVGLLPAALIGIDVEKLLQGAAKAAKQALSTDWRRNDAFRLAVTQYLLYKKGKNIAVFFPYAQKLWKLADWYRQLLAESIGKEFNRKGKRVNVGITPVPALGATDQHSQNQLYNEGPNDKFYLFLEVLKPAIDLKIPFDREWQPKEISYLKNVSFNRLLQTEMQGTMQALLKKNRPLAKISLERLDAENLGQLLVTLESSVAFLGELFGIDAFDQPGVELSKKLTKAMLTK